MVVIILHKRQVPLKSTRQVMQHTPRQAGQGYSGHTKWQGMMSCAFLLAHLCYSITTCTIKHYTKKFKGWWTYPLIFCGLLFWNSISSTVHTAPFTFSTRTKHLCRLRLWRTAFCSGDRRENIQRWALSIGSNNDLNIIFSITKKKI